MNSQIPKWGPCTGASITQPQQNTEIVQDDKAEKANNKLKLKISLSSKDFSSFEKTDTIEILLKKSLLV